MADRIHRVTLFKLPNAEDQQTLISLYEKLGKEQLKDGKPYILSLYAGITEPDQRSQGYTVVGKTEFASMEDMRFYDAECPAHAALKAHSKNFKHEGPPLSVYFKPGTSTVL